MNAVAFVLVGLLVVAPAPPAPPRAAPPARHATLPTGSPDGTQVVFCAERDSEGTELYVADVASGLSRRLTCPRGDRQQRRVLQPDVVA